MIRAFRLSGVITNSNPLYIKDERCIVYSHDKSVVVFNLNTGKTLLLNGHRDSVIGLVPDIHRSHYVISSGLDGKVIVWDIKTCEKIQNIETRFPIDFCFPTENGYTLSHSFKDKHSIKSYNCTTGDFVEIVNFPKGSKLTYKNPDFVACVHESELIVYWMDFNVSVRYPLPTSKEHSEKKKYTCIAAHPNDCILATGNAVGEIFIWWDLCSQIDNHLEMLNPISDNWIEDGNQPENDTFNDVKTVVKEKIKAGGRPLSYYPVHPSRVKRSLLHWHSMEVTSLCFTSCGAHLLSGGLEGVLLKWDMTECFGGPKKCRFLPHLGSPISSISSYGGFCEDTISVTLENNSFHILNSAFTLVYHKQGFMQLPRRWVQMPEFLMPKNLFILENHFMRSTGAGVAFGAQTTVSSIPTLVLANGGSGKLQLIDINDDQRNAQKIDITNQNHVVRLNTSKLPVMYSEVLLTAQLASEAEFTWLVTYECLKTSSDKSGLDNQSRLTWWQCRKVDDDIEKDGMKDDANVKAREFAKFTPIDTYSMAHFGCPAVGMGFVPTERKELYVLLADYRLMIWYFNEESKKHPLYSPWIPSSCHLLTCANPFESTMRPISTIITFNVNDNQTVEPLNCLLICSGASLTLFNWEQLVMQSHPNHTANLQLKSNLLELWPDCKKSFIDNCTVVVTAPPPSDCPTDTRCIVVTVRSQGSRSAEGRRLLYSTLCLIKCTPMSLEVASIIPNVHATCMTSHPNKSCIAIGLEDGTVAVYKLQLDSDVKLQLTHNLPSLAAQPFCDRKHKGGVKNREKNKKKSSGTQIISLDFIPSKGHNDVDNDDAKDGQLDKEGIQLVGIMRTTVGRETGRRDLVYYGIRRGQKCSSETEPPPHPSKHSKQGLLQLVDVASPVQFNGRSRPAKRKCDADHQLENTLKQISQYPIYTAPPPDQLLHQLMKKH